MKHHYVPQFLLSAWAAGSPDGKIEVYRLDLPGIPSSRRAPRYTGFEPDLYALSRPSVAGMEQQAIETRFLRRIDDLAAQARQKLADKGLRSLSSEERASWTRFLMSLRLRQPDLISYLKQESSTRFRETLAQDPEEYEAEAAPDDPPTLEEWADENLPGLIENIGLSFFSGIVENEVIGTRIFRMKWWLWDVAMAPHDLLIADNPCIFSAGIDDPDLIIALPISPTKAFFATQSKKTAEGLRNSNPRDVVTRLNESSINQAQVRIYARNKSHLRFVRNRRDASER